MFKPKKIRNAIDNLDEKNYHVVPKEDADPDMWAEVYPADKNHMIKLHLEFIEAPIIGIDSNAETLGHKVTHFNDVARTADYRYQGTQTCY